MIKTLKALKKARNKGRIQAHLVQYDNPENFTKINDYFLAELEEIELELQDEERISFLDYAIFYEGNSPLVKLFFPNPNENENSYIELEITNENELVTDNKIKLIAKDGVIWYLSFVRATYKEVKL